MHISPSTRAATAWLLLLNAADTSTTAYHAETRACTLAFRAEQAQDDGNFELAARLADEVEALAKATL